MYLVKNRLLYFSKFFRESWQSGWSPILLALWFALVVTGVAQEKQLPPQRVISLVPNITEMMFRMGLQDRLVGRTEYCNYPPQVKQLPSVGGYLDPDYETMLQLHADAVLLLPGAYYIDKFRQLGFRTIEIPNETIDDILTGFQILGKTFNRPQIAQQVIADIQDTLQLVKQQAIEIPLKALILIGHEPGSLRGLYAVSRGSFISELWERAGGRNIFTRRTPRYFPVSLETVVAANPDIIVDIHGKLLSEKEKNRCRRLWQRFPDLNAVQHHRIVVLDKPGILIPGPRITKTAIMFHTILMEISRQTNQ